QLLRRAAQGLGGLPEAGDYPGLAPGAYRADALLDLVHVGVLLEGHQPAVVATEGEDAYLVVRPQGLDGPDSSGLGDVGLDHTAGTVHELALFGAVAGPDRKSTRLNSSHVKNSYAGCCSKKKMGGVRHTGAGRR